jgi:hypothetical protein
LFAREFSGFELFFTRRPRFGEHLDPSREYGYTRAQTNGKLVFLFSNGPL